MEAQIRWTSVKTFALPIIRKCIDTLDVKRQDIIHTNAVLRTRYYVPQETVIVKQPRRVQAVGPTLSRKRKIVADSQKWSRSYGAEHPTAPATSSKFASLSKMFSPNTQSLCVTASGNEVFLITLKLKVAKDMSLHALVDGGASNNFVQRRSLDDSKHKFIECDISLLYFQLLAIGWLLFGCCPLIGQPCPGPLDLFEWWAFGASCVVMQSPGTCSTM